MPDVAIILVYRKLCHNHSQLVRTDASLSFPASTALDMAAAQVCLDNELALFPTAVALTNAPLDKAEDDERKATAARAKDIVVRTRKGEGLGNRMPVRCEEVCK